MKKLLLKVIGIMKKKIPNERAFSFFCHIFNPSRQFSSVCCHTGRLNHAVEGVLIFLQQGI
jgi:hypothetical protein